MFRLPERPFPEKLAKCHLVAPALLHCQGVLFCRTAQVPELSLSYHSRAQAFFKAQIGDDGFPPRFLK